VNGVAGRLPAVKTAGWGVFLLFEREKKKKIDGEGKRGGSSFKLSEASEKGVNDDSSRTGLPETAR